MSLDKFGRQKKVLQDNKIKCLENELRMLKSNYDELWLQVTIMQEDLKQMDRVTRVYKSKSTQSEMTV